jgi:hypothetical protein
MKSDLAVGTQFKRLTVMGFVGIKGCQRLYLCLCECGSSFITRAFSLLNGRTKSCGCLKKELCIVRGTKHGMYSSPEYRSWNSMKQRCTNPKDDAFSRYGGLGIKVCKRWRKFENFFADMGPRPEPKRLYSIDRWPNNEGNYEPSNCRWATRKQQRSNWRPTMRKLL